jgi:flagellar hook assembly protein FlgD
VKLQIFDIQGRVVKTLVDERKPMGTYRAVWDGTDNQGRPVSSGVYMAKLFQWGQDAGDFLVKITLIK